MSSEQALQAEIDVLKSRVADTTELYVQACYLLFFQHATTPSVTKLYQLIKKGSMTTVSEAVREFWSQLRDKSRIMVDHGGLPDDVRVFAGEMLGELWRRALGAAEDIAGKLKEEAEAALAHSQREVAEADRARLVAEDELREVRAQLTQQQEVRAGLIQKLATATGNAEALNRELQAQRDQVQAAQQALTAARTDFARELDKAREDVRSAESRFADMEKRAMVEIDRHRTEGKGLRKQLEEAQQKLTDATQRHESSLGDVREKLARVQGAYDAVSSERDRSRKENDELRARLASATADMERLQRSAQALKDRQGVNGRFPKKALRKNKAQASS